MTTLHTTGAAYDRKNRRWLLRMPRHHAPITNRPAPGKRMRVSRIASSSCLPSNPPAISSTNSGAASTPTATMTLTTSARIAPTAPAIRSASSSSPRSSALAYDGDERRREHAFAEQVLEEVREPERAVERRGHEIGAEVVRDQLLAHQAEDAREQDAGSDERGASRGARRRWRRWRVFAHATGVAGARVATPATISSA